VDAEDISDVGPIDFRDPAAEVLKPYRQYALAREVVRYVGDPVARCSQTTLMWRKMLPNSSRWRLRRCRR
jgi:hypothetical protein